MPKYAQFIYRRIIICDFVSVVYTAVLGIFSISTISFFSYVLSSSFFAYQHLFLTNKAAHNRKKTKTRHDNTINTVRTGKFIGNFTASAGNVKSKQGFIYTTDDQEFA